MSWLHGLTQDEMIYASIKGKVVPLSVVQTEHVAFIVAERLYVAY